MSDNGDATTGAAVDMAAAESILEKYGIGAGDAMRSGARERESEEFLIPILQDLQDAYGYLPREALEWVGARAGIPVGRMYGVITFYTQFHLEPKGLHTVRCCQGTACHVKGAMRVTDAICEHLGVEEGETTEDGLFTFETVQCLGTCFLAPVVMVDEDYHGEMSADSVKKVLDAYRRADDRAPAGR